MTVGEQMMKTLKFWAVMPVDNQPRLVAGDHLVAYNENGDNWVLTVAAVDKPKGDEDE